MRTSLARWRLFAALSLGWTLAVVVLYAGMVERLGTGKLRRLAAVGEEFFYWQAAGFLLLVAAAAILRLGILGRLTAIWLVLSTLAFLASSHDGWLAVQFTIFVLWCLAAVRSMQMAIERFAGEDQAAWGLAAATLYGAGLVLAFFLGLLGVLTFWLVTLIALVAALPGALAFIGRPVEAWRSVLRALDRLNPLGVAAIEAIWVCLALAFAWAVAPESLSDSIRSYLPDVQAMARHHSLAPQLVDVGRLLPRALQALFAMGYVVGAFNLAKLLSWFAMVPLAALIHDEIRSRSGDPNLGAVGAAAVVTCPLLLGLSTSLMYDHVMTLLCVAGFVSLFRALGHDSRQGVLLSAFIMGAGSSIKYNFLIFDLVWGLFLVAYAIRTRHLVNGLRWCVAPALVLGAAACPWYLYNWVTLGNPLFPFLSDVFESPYWPTGESPALKPHRFMLGEGIWNPVLFPWTVTFNSSRVLSGHDGRLGFALLALLPWILAMRRERHGLEFGLAGFAIVAAVCSQVSNARYWLPGLPLLLMPCILALGAGLDRARWRLPRWAAPITVPILLAVLWVQIPFWIASQWRFPWPVYSGKVTHREWTEQSFRGLPAIEELNRILEPGERVLATAYNGIHTVGGDAYEFPFWHRSYHGIEDQASFDGYVERSGVRYWVVSFSTADFYYFERLLGGGARYWSDARLVAGHADVGVFDLARVPESPRHALIESRQILPILSRPEAAEEFGGVEVWRDRFAGHPKKASRTLAEGIEIPPRGQVEYVFHVPSGSSMACLAIDLQSQDRLRRVSTSVEWLDGSRQRIGEAVRGGLNARQPRLETRLFAGVPEAARYGRLRVSRAHRLALKLGSLRIDFLTDDAEEAQRGSANTAETVSSMLSDQSR